MSDALLHLRRSENGLFVLVEPTSQTVVVDEDLGEAYARMCATLKEQPPAPAAAGSRPLFERRGQLRIAAIIAALLVPLAWAARIAVEVQQARVSCPPRQTRSHGHATRVVQTPSAFADREGTEVDDEADDEARKTAKPAANDAPVDEAPGPVKPSVEGFPETLEPEPPTP